MDESTSALDEVSQARMMEFLRTDLAKAAVISVTHRPGLEEFFEREITIVREGADPARTFERRYPRLRQFWQRVSRRKAGEPGPRPETGSTAA